jgi:DedD protein
MEHELKQRLIGAVVVTALAAIFIPMLFDDPVDTSGKTVTELTIPQAPAGAVPEVVQNLPENKAQVLERRDIELNAAEVNEDALANTTGEAPITDIPDGEQTEQQPGLAETGSVVLENEAVDGSATKPIGQALDTGDVPGSAEPEENQGAADISHESAKEVVAVPAKKSPPKPEVTQATKAKSVTPEKQKAVANTRKETTKKSSSKLVRYSIQAGSFNKKENARHWSKNYGNRECLHLYPQQVIISGLRLGRRSIRPKLKK